MRDRSTGLPLRFEDVTVADGRTHMLRGISLTLSAGAPTMLMGPNGSGKSTLLKTAMGLVAPSSGRITYAGQSSSVAVRLAFVFQKPVMLRRTAAANVAFALSAASRAADPVTVARLLDQAGLTAVAARPARLLSGGEQQRLALARALARDPEILILDEPTASLDPAQTKAVEDIIAGIAASGVKIIMATHDIGEARRLAGDVVFLANGRLVEHTPAPHFFETPQTEAARRFLAGELVI
jgi:tungstate transport system ATP-binding protein